MEAYSGIGILDKMDGLNVLCSILQSIQLPFIAYNVVEGLGYNKQLAMQRQQVLFSQRDT